MSRRGALDQQAFERRIQQLKSNSIRDYTDKNLAKVYWSLEDVRQFADALSTNTSLEKLHFSKHRFNVECMNILCAAIKKHPTLQDVTFYQCELDDDVICTLADQLKDSRIHSLNVGKNTFGQKGVLALTSLCANPNLTRIKVWGHTMDNVAYTKFHQSLGDYVLAHHNSNLLGWEPKIEDTPLQAIFNARAKRVKVISDNLRSVKNGEYSEAQLFYTHLLTPSILDQMNSSGKALVEKVRGVMSTLPVGNFNEPSSLEPVNGVSPLLNPLTWATLDQAIENKVAGISIMNKAQMHARTPDGNTYFSLAVKGGFLPSILKALHANGEQLTPQDLLNDDFTPNDLYHTIMQDGHYSALFTKENWVGQGRNSLRIVFRQLPPEMQDNVQQYMGLSVLVSQAEARELRGEGIALAA